MARDGLLLSVRGFAQRTVPPDRAELRGKLTARGASKAEALAAVAELLDRLTADLARLGGVPRTMESEREPLTWSAWESWTHAERRYSGKTQRVERTGRVIATVSLTLTVRALGQIRAIDAALAGHEALNVHDLCWRADDDNPVWAQVRAAALHDAVQRAREYAAVLHGSLLEVEHVADPGLLDGNLGGSRTALGGSDTGLIESFDLDDGRGPVDRKVPSLEPVPQSLTATIEARFTATGVALDGR